MDGEELLYYISIIVTIIAGVVITFLQYVNSKTSEFDTLQLSGVDVLHVIKNSKLFPVQLDKGWRLVDFCHNQRLWYSELCLQSFQEPVQVYAAYSKVKGSAQIVLNTLRDAHKLPEWDPEVRDVRYLTEPQDCTSKVSPGQPVQHEIVTMETTHIPNICVDIVNRFSVWLQGDVFVKKRKTLQRYWQREENNCAWLMDLDEGLGEWHFILAQPIDGLFEADHCLVTVLTSPHKSRSNNGSHLPSLRLSCLQQCLQYRKLNAVSLNNLSLPEAPKLLESNPVLLAQDPKAVSASPKEASAVAHSTAILTHSKSDTNLKSKSILNDIAKVMHEDPAKPESTFLKRFKLLIEEKKEEYAERKRKASVPTTGSEFKDVSKSKTEMESVAAVITESATESDQSELIILSQNATDEQTAEQTETEDQAINTSKEEPGVKTTQKKEESVKSETKDEVKSTQKEEVNLKTEHKEEQTGKTSPKEEPTGTPKEAVKPAPETNNRRSLLKFFRSSTLPDMPDGHIAPPAETKIAAAAPENPSKTGTRWIDAFRKSKSMDVVKAEPVVEEEVKEEELSEEDKELKELKIQEELKEKCDQTAADIMAEKVRVGNIEIGLPYDQQAARTGGWIYCGLEKDVVILRKIYKDGCPLQSLCKDQWAEMVEEICMVLQPLHATITHPTELCRVYAEYIYLGKAVIPIAPKNVFEAIKNPHTRFTYDEMLKGINIVKTFKDGMKIVHLQHEVSQLFRREMRDFCIVQREKIVGSKYIVSLVSVETPDCPEQADIVRAKFLSSGWIIEPAMKDDKLHTMLTYIVQMDLGHSKANTGYLAEELAAKQPLAISFLRQFLVPSPYLTERQKKAAAMINGNRKDSSIEEGESSSSEM